jgi:RNA polymerase sigma-70 factor, ECF subfamily
MTRLPLSRGFGTRLATLIRLLGDFDLAEEAMHEPFAAALETWPPVGVPDKPRPWVIFNGAHQGGASR